MANSLVTVHKSLLHCCDYIQYLTNEIVREERFIWVHGFGGKDLGGGGGSSDSGAEHISVGQGAESLTGSRDQTVPVDLHCSLNWIRDQLKKKVHIWVVCECVMWKD